MGKYRYSGHLYDESRSNDKIPCIYFDCEKRYYWCDDYEEEVQKYGHLLKVDLNITVSKHTFDFIRQTNNKNLGVKFEMPYTKVDAYYKNRILLGRVNILCEEKMYTCDIKLVKPLFFVSKDECYSIVNVQKINTKGKSYYKKSNSVGKSFNSKSNIGYELVFNCG
ncbi:MAG: hypothetical protein Q4C49_12845 [Bacillota bacterium]|nr:hypothetical protein [Bacillota bacterium]